MAKSYLILDAFGKVMSTHKWGGVFEGPCPVTVPSGGSSIGLESESLDIILSLMMGGQTITVSDGEVLVDDDKIGSIQNGQLVLE